MKTIDWRKVGKSLFIGFSGMLLTVCLSTVFPALLATGSPFWMAAVPVLSTVVSQLLKIIEAQNVTPQA